MTKPTIAKGACIGSVMMLAACAAGPRKAGSAAPAADASYGQAQGGYPQQPQQQPGAYPPPPGYTPAPPPPEPGAPPPPLPAAPTQPGGGAGGSASRTMAFSNALDEVDTSQRQLDVAAGDCNNACRALGSMDRAAGRLCGLAQGTDEARRCDDAKKKVYSARDRVKQTCGQCPGGASVERSAPIPSVK